MLGLQSLYVGRQKEPPMKFRPLHDRVVIRRAEGDTKSKGGIIIPDTAKEKPQERAAQEVWAEWATELRLNRPAGCDSNQEGANSMAVQNNAKQSAGRRRLRRRARRLSFFGDNVTCAAEIFSRRTFSDQPSKEHDR